MVTDINNDLISPAGLGRLRALDSARLPFVGGIQRRRRGHRRNRCSRQTVVSTGAQYREDGFDQEIAHLGFVAKTYLTLGGMDVHIDPRRIHLQEDERQRVAPLGNERVIALGQRKGHRAAVDWSAVDDRTQVTEIERRKIMLEDLSEVQATDERVKILKPLFEDVRKLQATRGAVSRDEAARVELDYIISHGRAIQLEAQKRREKLELTFAEQDRQLRRLVAPVAGVVARLDVNLGEWAKPGDPLVRLVDASVCHLRVNVPATAALGLREGSSMTVRFEPGLGLADVQGVVSFLSPAVDASSGLVELRLKFNNPTGRIAPGIKGFIRLGAAK